MRANDEDRTTGAGDAGVPDRPDVRPAYLRGRPAESAWRRIANGGDHRLRYGYGKAALHDGLEAVGCGPGANVVLPAYVPDGVVEPIRDLQAEPRFYDLDRRLGPDVDDLVAAVDDETVAVLAVNYFGFPQPRFEAIRDVAHDHGAVVVDDNAHSPLSRSGDTLLGTRGAFGFTSFRKGFPVPDGAVMYLEDEVYAALDPSGFAGVRSIPTHRDAGYVAASLLAGTGRRSAVLGRVLDFGRRLRQWNPRGGSGDGESSPGTSEASARRTYERAKRPMSALSEHIVRRTPADAVVQARRRRYRAWVAHLQDVDPVFDDLAEGVCPKVCPVVASAPKSVAAVLGAAGIGGVHTWPPLPADVADADGFSTTRWLADHLLTLPVHRDVPVEEIPDAAATLR